MTTTGTLDEFPFPAETYPSAVVRGGFVPGADGKLWFIRTNAPFKLGSITTAGVITDDEAPIPSMPLALGAEPSGAILVLMQLGSDTPDHSWDYKLARRSPSGEMTAFPKTATAMRGPVVEGSDGTIWIGSMLELHNTGSGTKLTPAVVRVTGLGSNEGARYETFPLGFPYETLPNLVNALFAGPDGDVFFSLNRDSGVGSMTYAGRVTKAGEIQFFSAQSFGTLLVDDDGNLWTTTLGSVDCNKPTVIDVFPKPDGGGADSFDVAVERSSPDVNAVDGPGPTPDATVDAATEPTQD
jgi:hypothetical protein